VAVEEHGEAFREVTDIQGLGLVAAGAEPDDLGQGQSA
jgi:hypothetical protein